MAYDSVFRPCLFAGRHIVVTGGGSGIGRCTAHELAALGARVALVGRRPEKLAAVVAEIAAAGGASATAHPCDIRVEEEVQPAVASIVEAHGRIDRLVNKAAVPFAPPLKGLSHKGSEPEGRHNLAGGFLP